jgi:hypothetical protein
MSPVGTAYEAAPEMPYPIVRFYDRNITRALFLMILFVALRRFDVLIYTNGHVGYGERIETFPVVFFHMSVL